MKSNFYGVDISIVETKVPEEVFVRAEELSDDNLLSGLTLNKDKEWEAKVVDNNIHFSILISLKKAVLEHYTCNCATIARHGICPHILVAVFAIRKKIEKEKVAKKKKTRAKSSSKSFDLIQFVNQLSLDDLYTFVLTKARGDKSFRLLLQAKFIEKMSTDQLAPFIESTFPILTKANEKVAASKLKAFIDIADELVNYFKNLISQSDLIEAYELAFLLLKKSFYIKYHLKTDHARFFKLHKTLLQNYIEVYKLIEAPEFKISLNDQLSGLLSTSYISASLKEEKDLWMLYYRADLKGEHIKSLVDSYLVRHPDSDYSSFYFIKMLELLLQGSVSEKTDLIKSKDMQEHYRIIQFLIGYKEFDGCQEVMYLFYTTVLLNHPLSKVIIENLSVKKDQITTLTDQSILYYLKYQDQAYLTFIQSQGKSWKKSKAKIISSILEKDDVALLVSFHLVCDEVDEAVKVLNDNLSWALLSKYDSELAELANDQCKELFYNSVEAYLLEHFGAHAQDFTKEVFNRIVAIDQKGWLPDLKERLAVRFPDRKNLFR